MFTGFICSVCSRLPDHEHRERLNYFLSQLFTVPTLTPNCVAISR